MPDDEPPIVALAPDEANEELPFSAVLDFAIVEGNDFSVDIRPRSGTRVVRLKTPTTRALRDLVGATFDMRRVAELCSQYVAAVENGAAQVVQDALWMTAIVLYARCFNGGIRQRLDTAVLDSLSEGSREMHDNFLDLRDEFVAHSVNACEQTLAYAVVGTDTNLVVNTGTKHLWANPINKQDAEALKGLAWAFYNKGMQDRALLGAMVDDEARDLDKAALARLPDLTIEVPNVAKGKGRRKL